MYCTHSDGRRHALAQEGGYVVTQPDGAFVVRGLDANAAFRVEAEHAFAGKAVADRVVPGTDDLRLVVDSGL